MAVFRVSLAPKPQQPSHRWLSHSSSSRIPSRQQRCQQRFPPAPHRVVAGQVGETGGFRQGGGGGLRIEVARIQGDGCDPRWRQRRIEGAGQGRHRLQGGDQLAQGGQILDDICLIKINKNILERKKFILSVIWTCYLYLNTLNFLIKTLGNI